MRPTPIDAGVMNHELEHWRRSGSYGEPHIPGPGPDGRELDFEGCAAAYYRLALNKGAMNSWILEQREALRASASRPSAS